MGLNFYSKVVDLLEEMEELKSKLLYKSNASGGNPIVAKIISFSDDFERVKLYITSGTTQDGYKEVDIEDLKSWATDKETFVDNTSFVRDEYFDRYRNKFDDIDKIIEDEKEYFEKYLSIREEKIMNI